METFWLNPVEDKPVYELEDTPNYRRGRFSGHSITPRGSHADLDQSVGRRESAMSGHSYISDHRNVRALHGGANSSGKGSTDTTQKSVGGGLVMPDATSTVIDVDMPSTQKGRSSLGSCVVTVDPVDPEKEHEAQEEEQALYSTPGPRSSFAVAMTSANQVVPSKMLMGIIPEVPYEKEAEPTGPSMVTLHLPDNNVQVSAV